MAVGEALAIQTNEQILNNAAESALAVRPSPADAPEPAGLVAIELELAQEPDPEPPPEVVLAEPGVSQSASPASGELPEALQRIVNARIMLWRNLTILDDRRDAFREDKNPPDISDELARQSGELQRVPSREQLEQSRDRLKTMFAKLDVDQTVAPSLSPAHSAGDSEIRYRNLLEIGVTQVELLLKRRQFDGLIPRAAISVGEAEPLLALCRRNGVDAETLLGWTYYAMAAQQRLAYLKSVEAQRQADVEHAAAKSSGLFSAIRQAVGGNKDAVSVNPQFAQMRRAAERELRAIEPELVELFWKLYEEVAWLLSSGKLNEAETPTARALLRYGLVSTHPGLIESKVLRYILDDCATDVRNWQNSLEALHVLYPDEYIPAICKLLTTPGPDEEMELNCRGTPQWKADHLWRFAVANRIRAELYKTKHQELKQTLEGLEQKNAAQEQHYQQLRGDPARQAEANAVSKEIASDRPQLGRLRLVVEQFESKLIPDAARRVEECRRKLPLAAQTLTPEMVVRREARHIRRLARLASRLKEPYLPFTLRNWFIPNRSDHHSRQTVCEAIAKLEANDSRIFQQTLISGKRLEDGVAIRLCPVFLIVPAYGQLGFTVCPRQPDDAGHLMLPLIAQRQGMLENMLIDMLADFRWDSSKADAGMNWVSAEALCAAYAAVRWNCRKLSDAVQTQAGFNRKQNDKQNWRYHYRLFITSVQERGRYLFNKSLEIYRDVVIKYIGLPTGLEPLRRD